MSCCDYGCTRAKNCPAGPVGQIQGREDVAQWTKQCAAPSIRHELLEGGGDIAMSWPLAIALMLLCIGLAGYAWLIFSK